MNFREHDKISEMAHGGRGCEFIREIPIEKESAKMPKYRIKVAPNTVAYADEENNKLVAEFAIPGAPTDTIDVKILEDSIHLTAPARDIEYVSALALGWPVKPDKAEANYEHGLLRIEVPFKDPMEDAVTVAIKAGGVEIKTKALLQKTPEKGPK
ncbi:MAG: Hsp20/alpha crystallin family protein [Candidatus Krumholzibacteria bacterium]|nr:Hsp20/alpha crystallin family protein [Candidatus Krumholzibacteria bacterium]